MASGSNITAFLASLELAPEQFIEADKQLVEFEALSEEEKKAARPVIIEKVFPLIFGDAASIESSANFEQLKKKPWSTNCYLSPKVIVTPSSASDVSKILTACRILSATFSIRGGGHLQNPGFTSNNGGVVICMGKFKDLTLSEDKLTASLGPGLTWLEAYGALEEYGLTVTGGRVPTVGVPGLLLGGGLSFQNSEHGFSCTGVDNYEVVLADGSIVNANAKENKDLFWALKGGCSNFGIVTRFDMATISNKVWAEARIFAPTANEQIIEALMLYHEAIEKDKKATLVVQIMDQATLLVFFYCAPVEKPDVFNSFYDIPFLMNVIPPGYSTVFGVVNGVANVLAPEPQVHECRMMASLPDLELYKAAEAVRLQQIESLKTQGIQGIGLNMIVQPIAASAMKACDAKGGNPMGITSKNHQWFLIMADVKDPQHEPQAREVCRIIVGKCEEVSKKNGTYLPFKYSNYSAGDQNPLATYGAENLQKLKDIALKYDPDQVFQKLQNGGWLLSRT